MTCVEFADLVRELARGTDGLEDARAHAEQCARCRERLEWEKQLSDGMMALAAAMEPLGAPPGVERRLRQAFRERHAPASRRTWNLLPWAAPVAAALAAAAFLIPALDRGVDALGGPDPLARLAAKAPHVSTLAPVPSARPRVRRERALPVVARRTAPDREQAAEVLTFTPVRFAPPLFPGESAEVIRVNLPGAAMRRFGVYVPPELAVRRVNADVLFGEDGVARAIRFVH